MSGAKPKLLIAEDDPFMISLLSKAFSEEGFEVVFANNGDEAVRQFGETDPDILVFDIMMPGKNGVDALREIRGLPKGKDTPAIILTNLDDAPTVSAAQDLNVRAYLVKANTQLSEIVNKVKQVLGEVTGVRD